MHQDKCRVQDVTFQTHVVNPTGFNKRSKGLREEKEITSSGHEKP
jgi:hypothetical protein